MTGTRGILRTAGARARRNGGHHADHVRVGGRVRTGVRRGGHLDGAPGMAPRLGRSGRAGGRVRPGCRDRPVRRNAGARRRRLLRPPVLVGDGHGRRFVERLLRRRFAVLRQRFVVVRQRFVVVRQLLVVRQQFVVLRQFLLTREAGRSPHHLPARRSAARVAPGRRGTSRLPVKRCGAAPGVLRPVPGRCGSTPPPASATWCPGPGAHSPHARPRSGPAPVVVRVRDPPRTGTGPVPAHDTPGSGPGAVLVRGVRRSTGRAGRHRGHRLPPHRREGTARSR